MSIRALIKPVPNVHPLFNREVCGGDFETNIIRSQWDILWGLQFGFEDAVKLIIQVEAISSTPRPRP